MTCFLQLKICYTQGNNMIRYKGYYNVQHALKFKIYAFSLHFLFKRFILFLQQPATASVCIIKLLVFEWECSVFTIREEITF